MKCEIFFRGGISIRNSMDYFANLSWYYVWKVFEICQLLISILPKLVHMKWMYGFSAMWSLVLFGKKYSRARPVYHVCVTQLSCILFYPTTITTNNTSRILWFNTHTSNITKTYFSHIDTIVQNFSNGQLIFFFYDFFFNAEGWNLQSRVIATLCIQATPVLGVES